MTRPNSHLSPEEIDRLSLRPEGHGEDGDSFAESDRHVAGCDVCRTKLRLLRNAQQRLAGLRVAGAGEPGRDCPGDVDWLSVAAGLTNGDEASRLLDHATQCDACGPLLRQAAEDLSGVPATEDSMLASLKSAQPRWQTELARRMSAQATSGAESGTVASARAREFSSVSRRRSWRPAFTWALGLAAALLMAVVAGLMLRNRTGQEFEQRLATAVAPTQPAALLAQAYTEQRDLELRIAGARYAPMNQQRAGRPSRFNRPADLLKAESDLAAAIQRQPDDPSLLAAQARADLLEWDYEAAIQTLKRVEESQPDSAPLLTDLASAHFERAEAEGREIDYGTAIELLGKALDQNPNDPVALYNRAVCYEKMFMYHQAAEDWRRYLQIDPKGDWTAPARQHLATVEEKLKAHDGAARQSSDPAAFVSLALAESGHPAAASANQIDGDTEGYLDLATTVWLPQAFPDTTRTPSSVQARQALRILAGQLSTRHHDLWLKDMLLPRNSHAFALGVAALSRAVKANQAGEPSDAQEEAAAAADLFRSAGSKAGELRSRVEQVYAFHRSAAGNQCLNMAEPTASAAQSFNYGWIEVQSILERSICRGMINQIGVATVQAAKAVSLAGSHHYGTIELRSLGMEAGFETGSGDLASGFSLDRRGLELYWSGTYPPVRAFQFYSDLVSAAEELGQMHLAVALNQDAVDMIAMTPNRSVEADARFRLATDARLAGASSIAEQEYLESQHMFASLKQDPALWMLELNNEIGLAAVEVQQNELDQALVRLQSLRRGLPEVDDYMVRLTYFRTLGALYLKRQDVDSAERAFRAVIAIGEAGLEFQHGPAERLQWEAEILDAYQGLVEILIEHRHASDAALDLQEWYRAAAFRSKRLASPPLAQRLGVNFDRLDAGPPLTYIDRTENLLASLHDATVVSYMLLRQGVAIWVFDDRGIHSAWVPVSESVLDAVARRFKDRCANPGSDLAGLQQDARQLYAWLLEPVAKYLAPSRTLIVEPDRSARQIPFQVLMRPDGEYLGSIVPVSYSPGLACLRHLRHDSTVSPGQRLLVVGNPVTGKEGDGNDFTPLPDADAETEAVSRSFRNVTLLTGRDVTLEAVQRELPKAEVFHFAGHAVAGRVRSGLLIGNNNAAGLVLLDLAHFQSSQMLRCTLAVFSSCPTDDEQEAASEVDNLVQEVLGAGVPHVVASRWPVDSSATKTLMRAFYSELLAGAKVTRALQMASVSVRGSPGMSHPYYWAAFSSFGSP